MTSGIEFNKGCISSYIMLPLKKNNGQLSVTCFDRTASEKISAKDSMKNLDELRLADTDRNGILSLNELRIYKDKTEFMEKLTLALEKFNANPNRDYTKSLFEEYV